MGIIAYHVGSRAAEPVMSLLRDKLHPSNENDISNGPAGKLNGIYTTSRRPAVCSHDSHTDSHQECEGGSSADAGSELFIQNIQVNNCDSVLLILIDVVGMSEIFKIS